MPQPEPGCGEASFRTENQAYWISFQVTALRSNGGIVFPLAIGAVVVGYPTTCQTPLSGHFSPVLAVVPNGTRFRDSTAMANLLGCRSKNGSIGVVTLDLRSRSPDG